ncbi:MAG: 30S ribosome-binding factor RbfA [Pseudomonadales bacterium]|nr:30S ribosome-binding factor RbfA [Pseudomonadales bacterium]
MPKDFSRGRRIADLIQRELASLIQKELKDPRIGMVTINEVKVSRDLSYADVYFTMFQSQDAGDSVEALNHASGFLRTQLSKVLNTRTTPRLRFHYDETINTGERISRAIDNAIAEDSKRKGE